MKKSGINLDDLQDINRALMIHLLQEKGSCSRADLAKASGLTQASITKIIRDLVNLDIVVETGYTGGVKGRRSISLSLNCEKYKVLAIKVARRSISSCVYDISGKKYTSFQTSQEISYDPYCTINTIVSHVRYHIAQTPEIKAIGIALMGFYLYQEDRIALIGDYTYSWHNVSIQKEVQSFFNIPVFVEHDANAGALAYWTFGSFDKASKHVLLHIIASEGIGAGVVIKGKIYHGGHGIAGEAGHLSIDFQGRECECGSKGCLQQYCSSLAVEKYAKIRLKDHPESILNEFSEISVHDIFYAMRKQDPFSCEIIKETGTYLGYGLVNLVNLFDPDMIVISDLMVEGDEYLLSSAKDVLKSRLLPDIYKNLTVRYSEIKDDLILLGAGAVAIAKILAHPSQYLTDAG